MSPLVHRDNSCSMSQQQEDRARESISKSRGERPCAHCGASGCDTLLGIAHLIVNSTPDYQTDFGATFPMVLIACSKCHAVTLYGVDVIQDQPSGITGEK